ncbi:MAG: glucosamine-6-phosphate deaminase [Candidatus Pelethousia sp.]|nr:glucosamine-6-phosphate deaminase [Candidatus Pelethousia sp.]
MRIYCAKDYQTMSRRAANIISAHVIIEPSCVLGLATGSTPLGAYKQLGIWCAKGDLSFAQVHTLNLDEYVGLGPEHPQSYRYFMQKSFFDHIDICPANTNLPNGLAEDAEEECRRYNRVIQEFDGVDLQLLGIGHNGHIGFNEPGQAFELETHRIFLSESTIEANARFFSSREKVPKAAYTMGIKNIMQAKKILVVVRGEEKADIVYRAFRGPVIPEVPASILQLHPNVTLCGDQPALQKLIDAGVEVCA